MPSSLTYYFAGVGTAGVALVAGFGGALIFSNALMKDAPPPPTRLERVAKSLPQAPSQNANSFPSQAAPVLGTPMPIEVTQKANNAVAPQPLVSKESEPVEQLKRPEVALAAEGEPVEKGGLNEVSVHRNLLAEAGNQAPLTPRDLRERNRIQPILRWQNELASSN